jgi:hypothetical protein
MTGEVVTEASVEICRRLEMVLGFVGHHGYIGNHGVEIIPWTARDAVKLITRLRQAGFDLVERPGDDWDRAIYEMRS